MRYIDLKKQSYLYRYDKMNLISIYTHAIPLETTDSLCSTAAKKKDLLDLYCCARSNSQKKLTPLHVTLQYIRTCIGEP